MKKIFGVIVAFTLLLSLSGCKEKPIQEYHGWIVIEMHKSYDIGGNVISIVNPETMDVKDVKVYKYYFDQYNLGDTINCCNDVKKRNQII